MKILIIGLGNPILGDDGIGWKVVERAQQEFDGATYDFGASHQIDYKFLSLGGISLMEQLIGYDKVIIIDAINTGTQPQGNISIFPLSDLSDHHHGHLSSPHDTNLPDAIKIGKLLGAQLPTDIMIVAIESKNVYDFSEELSIPVAESIPKAIEELKRLLMQGETNP